MTKDELDILHRDYLNHTRTSIEYAISVLEELVAALDTEMLARSRLMTQVKIQELKAILK